MATPAKALRTPHRDQQPDRLMSIPNPANVRARAAEIRRGWTPSQRRHRAQLARYMVWRKLLGGM
jgi:hypothetical protein